MITCNRQLGLIAFSNKYRHQPIGVVLQTACQNTPFTHRIGSLKTDVIENKTHGYVITKDPKKICQYPKEELFLNIRQSWQDSRESMIACSSCISPQINITDTVETTDDPSLADLLNTCPELKKCHWYQYPLFNSNQQPYIQYNIYIEQTAELQNQKDRANQISQLYKKYLELLLLLYNENIKHLDPHIENMKISLTEDQKIQRVCIFDFGSAELCPKSRHKTLQWSFNNGKGRLKKRVQIWGLRLLLCILNIKSNSWQRYFKILKKNIPELAMICAASADPKNDELNYKKWKAWYKHSENKQNRKKIFKTAKNDTRTQHNDHMKDLFEERITLFSEYINSNNI